MRNELTAQMLNLQQGSHLCLLYDKDPAEQMPALVPFIQDGLTNDEQVIYVADDQTLEELTERLEESGIDVDAEARRGALRLWTRREWRQPGELCSEKKSLQVIDVINESYRSGFKGSRFAVEMTWTLGPDISTALIEHWEATLNKIFVPGSHRRIICQYNRSRLASEVLFAALRTHPLAILGDHIYPNVFYEAPLILNPGGNGASTAARVDWMIAQLERARSAQEEREALIKNQTDLTQADMSKKKVESLEPAADANVHLCGAINAFQDVTTRKHTEAELRQAKEELASINAQLELRVQERTDALQRAHAALLCEVEEQRRLEEQLRQAQKMESIGTLAGGIAHDFNNILNIIRGYSSLIGRHASADDRIQEALKVIEEEIERGAAVVRQLLTAACKTEAQLTVVKINDTLAQLSSLLKQTLPKTIEVILDLDPAVPALLADSDQISQALLNICVNARDAMPAGGSVTLRSWLAAKNTLPQGCGPAPAEYYVCIEVIDSGVGIEASVRSRIFEPFYTTKGIGQGTGLGLAIAYGIIKDHNGFIAVDSEPGHGSVFRLYFPVTPMMGKTQSERAMGRESSKRDRSLVKGTILVAEDEAPMADLLERMLTECGHRVLLARDGEEAINLYSDCEQQIDAVLLDVGLPKISGLDLISDFKDKHPNTNVVVASGYLEPAIKSTMYQLGVKEFVNKPYRPEAIVDKLQALVQKSAPPTKAVIEVSG